MILLWTIMVWAGPVEDSLREENKALREAIQAYEEEVEQLRSQVGSLEETISHQDKAIRYQREALQAARDLDAIHAEKYDILSGLLESSEQVGQRFEGLYRQELKKRPGSLERIAWVGVTSVLAGLVVYQQVKGTGPEVVVVSGN